MSDADYIAMIKETLRKMVEFHKEKERLDVEIAKLRQFYFATLNMLPDKERAVFVAAFKEVNEDYAFKESSLKDAIYNVLRGEFPNYLTSARVRDHLRAKGFDFSGYISNELASISTTLRRFKPHEVELADVEGVAAYRSKAKARFTEALTKTGRLNKSRLNKSRYAGRCGSPAIAEDT
jgi:hypothetical protein